jgi:hypothetical protein
MWLTEPWFIVGGECILLRSDAISIFTPVRVLLRLLYKVINVQC